MVRPYPVTVAVEGATDIPIAQRLLSAVGLIGAKVYQQRGKANLDRNLAGYNSAARFSPWFVVRDLDSDAACAAALAPVLLPSPTEGMCFRIAVREVEAWLLADRKAIAGYLGVSISLVPVGAELLPSPKESFVNLARRSSRRLIRQDIVPEKTSGAVVGPGYLGRISEFVREYWDPSNAAEESDSLRRCLARLKTLAETIDANGGVVPTV